MAEGAAKKRYGSRLIFVCDLLCRLIELPVSGFESTKREIERKGLRSKWLEEEVGDSGKRANKNKR
jgi:hypothetical protein